MFISMVPNMGSTLTFIIIVFKEDQAGGMSWSELSTPVNASDNLTLLDIWLSNMISCLISLTFIWYMDNVRPGAFGVAKKLWFPFERSYWCGDNVDRSNSTDKDDLRDKKMFEAEPNKERGVEVNGLRKVFNDFVAVDSVTFNAYKGEITALLGHNGAGKTTTMSMLTGLFSPSAGSARLGLFSFFLSCLCFFYSCYCSYCYFRINGCNIITELESARERMGLCPQHNMLFPRYHYSLSASQDLLSASLSLNT